MTTRGSEIIKEKMARKAGITTRRSEMTTRDIEITRE